ncbi:Flavonol 4'-sulfotransferase [Triticum urartu]|uniref:Sulfotransferase n=1 Tax=Triticum urartu TaxID=4572 RepID=M7ZBS7_TRIUA|nr:Flavonol 4'-sulfotransferase [Triticum urartu]
MAKAPGAPLGPVPFADVEADSGLVSGVPEQLPEEHADPDDLVSALPSAPRPKGLSSLRLYDGASAARPDGVLFLRYEELLRDPAGHVREVARFVGLPFSGAEEDAGVVHDIVNLCSFGHLKTLEANKTGHMNAGLPIPRDALFRKGVAGDWVNHMTPEMARRLDDIVADKLHAAGLTFLHAASD